MFDKLYENIAKRVAIHIKFNKVIGEVEVALENPECSHARYLSLKISFEKIYEDL